MIALDSFSSDIGLITYIFNLNIGTIPLFSQ